MISIAIAAWIASFPAHAENSAPAASSQPVAAPSVSLLRDRYVEAQLNSVRMEALDRIAKTAPVSAQDVANLFDLFSRFTDRRTREAVMASLELIEPGSPHLEPLFMTYLRQPEPEAQLFGINGAFRLRARSALPLIRSIAGRKFSADGVSETTMLSERNAWWTQYEALSVLAQWEGEKAYPLIEARSKESGKVGTLLGRYFWRKTLPQLKRWSESGEAVASERAAMAAAAPIDPEDARATRAEMLALMRDAKVDGDIRHRLALKIGASSTDEEAEEIVREHDAAPNDSERLYWAAAAFSSRSPKAVPLIARYARSGDETMRQGAREQLVDMVGEEEARALIDSGKKEK